MPGNVAAEIMTPPANPDKEKGKAMRFFHLSDLHIGLKLIGKDLREDQEYILKEIVRLAGERKPDAVVIAGDLYDKAVPSAEAVEVFDHFICALIQADPSAEIMMISGNHDSAMRINVFRNVLCHQKIHMIGLPPMTENERIEKVTLQDEYGPVNFYLLPFVRPSMVRNVVGTREDGSSFSYEETIRRLLGREAVNPEERNVLVSHQFYLPSGEKPDEVERMESEICTVGNIDAVGAEVLEPFDYAALGHIHKPMKVGTEFFRYCGTPLALSVSEAGQKKGIVEVELGPKGSVRTEVLPLIPLRRIRVLEGTLEEVLKQGCGDYVRVVLTDREDRNVPDMQDRLRSAFPNLLEIRRKTIWKSGTLRAESGGGTALGALELCRSFLKDLDGEEERILRDVINTVENRT